MLPKYLASLTLTVLLVSLAASSFQFATRSQVLSGKTVDENWKLEFTVDADHTHTYEINSALKSLLESTITFVTEGPVRIISSSVEVTPKQVSWTENNKTITSAGAAVSAHVQWATPPDSPNGTHGLIYIQFPDLPSLTGKGPTFHSGGYQKDDHNRYVLREVNTYKSPALLFFARFAFALSVGLPFGIFFHCIFWGFVLWKERRTHLAELPPRGSTPPFTFYPNPTVEWNVWTIFFGLGSFAAAMMAGISTFEGFVSSTFIHVILITLGIGATLAGIFAYFTRRSLLTVRVDANAISYARGRSDQQWLSATWNDILLFSEKSRNYHGNTRYWLEIKFKDKRKKLKIGKDIEGYADLRTFLFQIFKPVR